VQTLDLNQEDYLKILKRELPEVIILDSNGTDQDRNETIIQILTAASDAKVISLNLASDSVRFFCSMERKVNDTKDLVRLIQTFSGMENL
jgi:DNA-binding NarL/FixJ family response regulator